MKKNESQIFHPSLEDSLSELIKYLSSDEAVQSLRRDPYWPKWNSPWWQMLALYETGHGNKIPLKIISVYIDLLKTHYLKTFPFDLNNLPAGIDGARNVMCHCALGSAYLIVDSAGGDLKAELPWLREWFLNYQLKDGGYNCDEGAYLKEKHTSSMVSSLPMFEALLKMYEKNKSDMEIKKSLDRSAKYLIDRKFFRRISNKEVMDPEFLKLLFPRFYLYDILRGIKFIANYFKVMGHQVDNTIFSEALTYARQSIEKNEFRKITNLKRSLNPTPDGQWEMGEASTFGFLNYLSEPNIQKQFLLKEIEQFQNLIRT